ncbi:telomeric repeat-binding factor 1 [Microcaecilia unicolor]|uniref:Telomeric repeat-binding factor 1 n=1 Tax=Microcaecilia unicolor TaxID=1415580 RepID=A0A6P7WZ60_9AMPH|nr:telomeric repeat-binding factor 1 [Microcaecilia unicolor]
METLIETSDSQSVNAKTLAEPHDSAPEGPPDEPYDSATEGLPEGIDDLAAEGRPEGPHHHSPADSELPELKKELPLSPCHSGTEESLDEGPRDFANKKPTDSAKEETSDEQWREIPAASCSSCSLSASLSSEAVEVASGWVLDFMVSCLCQYFKDGRMTEFARTRDSTEAFIHGLTRLNQHQRKKVYMCQFLARIAEGKNLDVHFEKDEKITPLESALLIWGLLKKLQVEADTLHEEIQLLVQVQAIAVCMEKGYFKQATEVLERQCAGVDLNKSLRMKLAMIINGKDPYHPFLQNFSYNRMMDKIKSYVGMFLNAKSPSDFLMTAAMKVVQTKRKSGRISEAWENGSEINFSPMESEDNEISVANEKSSLKKKRNTNHTIESFNLTDEVFPSMSTKIPSGYKCCPPGPSIVGSDLRRHEDSTSSCRHRGALVTASGEDQEASSSVTPRHMVPGAPGYQIVLFVKAAMKVVQTKRKSGRISEAWENGSEINFSPMESEDNEISVANEKSSLKKKRNTNHHHRSQKQLFASTKNMPWNPEQCSPIKKSTDRRYTCWQNVKNKKNETSFNENGSRKKQIWLWEEDRKLKEGVKKFGVGNWSRILAHYDFKNRTSVMLKDRWRTMKKLNMVSSDSEG